MDWVWRGEKKIDSEFRPYNNYRRYFVFFTVSFDFKSFDALDYLTVTDDISRHVLFERLERGPTIPETCARTGYLCVFRSVGRSVDRSVGRSIRTERTPFSGRR